MEKNRLNVKGKLFFAKSQINKGHVSVNNVPLWGNLMSIKDNGEKMSFFLFIIHTDVT